VSLSGGSDYGSMYNEEEVDAISKITAIFLQKGVK
jgi:hypothetical protein